MAIIRIPIELRQRFDSDPDNFIRDIACIPLEALRPFFRRKGKSEKTVSDTLWNPFDDFALKFRDDFTCTDNFRRYMHIDLAVSRDSVGISMCHASRFITQQISMIKDGREVLEQIKVPFITFDFIGKISAVKGEEIILGDIRELIYMTSRRHFYITLITFDRFNCLHGSTKIKLLDGTSSTIEELSKMPPGKDYWVYSWDNDRGMIVPGKAKNARKTGNKVPIYKITIDNGEFLLCTGGHPILMRDGTYKLASELKINDSVMPLYFRKKKFNNHKIKAIEFYGYDDVYDLEVENYHNFGLESGIFVHNSVDSIQILKDAGYTTTTLSIDRTTQKILLDKHEKEGFKKRSTEGQYTAAYESLKQVIYTDRLLVPRTLDGSHLREPWIIESKELEHNSKRNKIACHPGGSSDLIESMAGSVFNCVNNEFEYIEMSEEEMKAIEDPFYDTLTSTYIDENKENIESDSDDFDYR